jgi:hypothetical protein
MYRSCILSGIYRPSNLFVLHLRWEVHRVHKIVWEWYDSEEKTEHLLLLAERLGTLFLICQLLNLPPADKKNSILTKQAETSGSLFKQP